MTIRLSADGTIELDGICPIEDAETLQQLLAGRAGGGGGLARARSAYRGDPGPAGVRGSASRTAGGRIPEHLRGSARWMQSP